MSLCDGHLNNMQSISLSVKGIGHVPSFKNSKMLTRGKLITDPKKQKWMAKCTKDIESQLRCWFLITEIGTATECTLRYRTVSSLPLDDCLDWIGSHSVSWRKVNKGEEGAIVEIEAI